GFDTDHVPRLSAAAEVWTRIGFARDDTFALPRRWTWAYRRSGGVLRRALACGLARRRLLTPPIRIGVVRTVPCRGGRLGRREGKGCNAADLANLIVEALESRNGHLVELIQAE